MENNGYVSRNYLREYYSKIKYDMENCLQVLDDSLPDKIDNEDVKRCFNNIENSSEAILNELNHAMKD